MPFVFAFDRTGHTLAAAGWLETMHVWRSPLATALEVPLASWPPGQLAGFAQALDDAGLQPGERGWLGFAVQLADEATRFEAERGRYDAALGGPTASVGPDELAPSLGGHERP